MRLAEGEGRKLLGLIMLNCLVCHLRRDDMRRRYLPADAKPDWMDHPIVPYLLENLGTIGSVVLVERLMPLRSVRSGSYVRTALLIMLRGAMVVNGSLLYQKIVSEYVYAHVPYFSEKTKPREDLKTIMKDYVKCNFMADLFLAPLQAVGLRTAMNDVKFEESISRPIKVFPLVGKMMFARLVVDVAFYVVHRWLHTEWAYKNIHARHHEHTAPRLQTNYHFEALDIFLEAALPLMIALGTAHAVGIRAGAAEQEFLAATLIWFEGGSHNGKELPIVTWFPILSPILNALTGCDRRLVEYHTKHHQLFNANYSISPWPDKIMGSYMMEYKTKDEIAEEKRARGMTV